MTHDRGTFQKLAVQRLTEAKLLLAKGLPSGAYYLAGYAIECALKAIIAASFRADVIPDLKRVREVYVHDLAALLRLAQLESSLDAENRINPVMLRKWAAVKIWSEGSRYEVWTEADAAAIIGAIDGEGGLFRWLQKHW